jgi:hypothetical protein
MEEVDGAVTTQPKRLYSVGAGGRQMATNKGPGSRKLDALPTPYPREISVLFCPHLCSPSKFLFHTSFILR